MPKGNNWATRLLKSNRKFGLCSSYRIYLRRIPSTKILAIIGNGFILPNRPAPLAQLDRASGYEPEGREFESLRAHHDFQPFTSSLLPEETAKTTK